MKTERRGTVYSTQFNSWQESIPSLLAKTGLEEQLADSARPILIKPNLVEALAPPITTPVDLVFALVEYLQTITDSRIIIGEGSGAMDYETWYAFDELGYTSLAEQLHIELVDLNNEELIRLSREDCHRWPEMYLPRIALESFLLSVPVLKAHSMAKVTLTMKNMIGLAPPSHYRQGNSWKKSAFHNNIQDAIADLNRYRTPDFTLLDATVGMPEAHLWGPSCDPPINALVASYDPVAVDAYGSGLLDKPWQTIEHIQMVDGELGQASPITVLNT